ncbi:Protein T10E9.8, partial [Aphelenchoides avenae]
LVGVILERNVLVHCQIVILSGLVVVSDVVAFLLVATMAVGTRSRLTAQLPGYLFNEARLEALLGPFWIYLTAILFHMMAAATMCIIGINRRYSKYLGDKSQYSQLTKSQIMEQANVDPNDQQPSSVE